MGKRAVKIEALERGDDAEGEMFKMAIVTVRIAGEFTPEVSRFTEPILRATTKQTFAKRIIQRWVHVGK